MIDAIRAWLRRRAERAAKRRFEATTPEPVAICDNCRQPFAMFDDDIILTFDDTVLCRPCADRIEAIAVAS
jgi:hypothetical protein